MAEQGLWEMVATLQSRERVFRRLRLLRGSAAGLSGKRLSAVAILTDDRVMKQELGQDRTRT
jgi:hypothetical protein